jgi:repressor LexA
MRVINENDLGRMLEYIIETQKGEGRSPSQREMMKKLRMTAPRVLRYVHLLAESGKIELNRDNTIAVPAEYDVSDINIVSFNSDTRVACGSAILIEEGFERNFALPDFFTGSGDCFMIRAKGDSMTGIGVMSGDYLIIRKQPTADFGDVVMAAKQCDEDIESVDGTLKKYTCENGEILLRPCNDDYGDIPFEGFRIIGVLVTVIRRYKR